MCNALLLTVLIEPVEKPTMLLYSDHHGVYVYELVSGNASKLLPVKDVLSLDYSFDYQMRAGEPVQAPYPLTRVIGATACDASYGLNGHTGNGSGEAIRRSGQRTSWPDLLSGRRC